MGIISIALVGSLASIGLAIILSVRILRQSEGTARMREITKYIREGANAYLRKQYGLVFIFFGVIFGLLWLKVVWVDWELMGGKAYWIPFAFISGGLLSGLAGYFGMKIATQSNGRTAFACGVSLGEGLKVAFHSGTVMGMLVVGLGLFHIIFWYFILGGFGVGSKEEMVLITSILVTSCFGASVMALFARVGGGIFTKAADVGADLVGKLEAGIPEDDPRNPAVIADNVGDNVGDVAGMGADLYESYIGSIIATMAIVAIGGNFSDPNYMNWVISPLMVSAVGVIASIMGVFFVRIKGGEGGSKGGSSGVLLWALRRGIYLASGVMVLATFMVVDILGLGIGVFLAVLIGLVAGNVIGYSTEYFTSSDYRPTKGLARESQTGPATIIIGGLSLGYRSIGVPVMAIVLAIIGAYACTTGLYGDGISAGLYGIGMAAVGMLSTLGITLATDAYGPVADNAGGVAEMSDLDPNVREKTDTLDALGNTTAATGKGFAIGSAALTSLTLIFAYTQILEPILGKNIYTNLNITNPDILIGLFIGTILPFFFSAMTMNAVGRAASKMVEEVRRQFEVISGIMEGEAKPDYASCVKISTMGAQKEMMSPAFLAIFAPILTGIIFGFETVISLLVGSLVCGFALAVMMSNAGGAWDNAKKYIEGGFMGGKGSPSHKSAIVGDTVGDPFKDTSGPSINILLKIIAMVSIIFAPVVNFLHQLFLSIFSIQF